MNYYFTLAILLLSFYGQAQINIHTEHCNHLMVGINNFVTIDTPDSIFLSSHNVKAFLHTPNNFLNNTPPTPLKIEKIGNQFQVHPDSIGEVIFHISLKDTVIKKALRTQYIKATCRVAGYKANSDKMIPARRLRQSFGISALIECCGFDARCSVSSFEVIRIDANGNSHRAINLKSRFESAALTLIRKASPQDIYIFRKIYYRCPATPDQRSEDIILEVE